MAKYSKVGNPENPSSQKMLRTVSLNKQAKIGAPARYDSDYDDDPYPSVWKQCWVNYCWGTLEEQAAMHERMRRSSGGPKYQGQYLDD